MGLTDQMVTLGCHWNDNGVMISRSMELVRWDRLEFGAVAIEFGSAFRASFRQMKLEKWLHF